jgi:hypothetical protein
MTSLSSESHSTLLDEIHYHALSIASISLSPGLPGAALVVTVNPLFYGKHESLQWIKLPVLTKCSCEAYQLNSSEVQDLGLLRGY